MEFYSLSVAEVQVTMKGTNQEKPCWWVDDHCLPLHAHIGGKAVNESLFKLSSMASCHLWWIQ
jgi:hypothetical protein